MNINHLHLKVRAVEPARAFYARFFGMRDHVWHGEMLFMRDEAGMDLALAPEPAAEPLPAWFHFGFRLGDADAVRALHDRMAAEGAPITEPLTVAEDLTFFRCADPDGHSIEVYFEPDPA
ncbi:MAG TPA: VOC family protein [Caulobacteraceae bacterium]|nr:VOC family protein [Caulobacteraceae bacterium]